MRFGWAAPAALALAFVSAHGALAQGNGKQVSVMLANETIPLVSHADTVGGFLSELPVAPPDASAVQPAPDSELQDGMTIQLEGVTVSRGTTEREVPVEVQFSKCYRYGPEECMVVDPGQAGQVRTDYTIFSANGVEIGRRSHDEVEQPMRPKQVVCFVPLSADDDGPSIEQILTDRAQPGPWSVAPEHFKRSLSMSATAYEPGPRSCGRSANGLTANGTKAGYGVVAVDPRVIPLGTRLFIEGYGYAVAADTGGAIDGNDIDLGYLTVSECLQWGRRKVKVYVLY